MANLNEGRVFCSDLSKSGAVITLSGTEQLIDTLVEGTESWDIVTIECISSAAVTVTIGWGGATGGSFDCPVAVAANTPTVLIDRWAGNQALKVYAKTNSNSPRIYYSKQRISAS